MKSGIKFSPDARDNGYLFHEHYGVLSPTKIPDDFLFGLPNLPNQVSDGSPTGCTGYTQADNEGDVLGVVCSPDFSLAAGIEAEGGDPSKVLEEGCDFRSSLQGVINRGVLKMTDAQFNAKQMGEAFVADIRNWGLTAAKALPNTENSYRWCNTGPNDTFDNIRSACWLAKKGLSMASPFFAEWIKPVAGSGSASTHVGDDGIAPVPVWHAPYSNHNWAIKGSATRFVDGPNKGQLIRNGEVLIVAKTHQGFYEYFDRTTINMLFSMFPSQTGVAVVCKDGNRMWNILCWLATRFPDLLYILPKLYTVVQ